MKVLKCFLLEIPNLLTELSVLGFSRERVLVENWPKLAAFVIQLIASKTRAAFRCFKEHFQVNVQVLCISATISENILV